MLLKTVAIHQRHKHRWMNTLSSSAKCVQRHLTELKSKSAVTPEVYKFLSHLQRKLPDR